jgi:predicted Zn-dependent protease
LLLTTGAPDEGIVALQHALKLSPKDPRAHIYLALQGLCHFVAGRHVDAVAYARESSSRQPADPAPRVLLAASLATAGNGEEARRALAAGPPIVAPELDRLWVIDWLHEVDRERVKDGLRAAGWQEG